jgi:hypothetical protein
LVTRVVRLTCLLASALIAILVGSDIRPAQAGLEPYVLNGGINNRQFWMDPNMINVAYMPLIRAANTDWNNTGTRYYMTETSSRCCTSVNDFYARDYTPQTFRGVTMSYLNSGAGVQTCIGCAPFANWDYSEISLNDAQLKYDCCVLRTQSTVSHEIGHSIRLTHSSVASAVMYGDISRYDLYGTYYPRQNDDIYWASQVQ